MANIMFRYDLRRPEICNASKADLYRAAIEQCAWGEQHGFLSAHLSEHHGSEDGYCPSPLLLASAIAARTHSLQLYISALIAPLHDPVQLAEDLAVLDIISRGRVIPVLSGGYRESEFHAMGGASRPAARRAAQHADFFIPADPVIFEYYREELKKLGKPDPGPMPAGPSTVTFVAKNPDEYWQQIAPHVMHETNVYADWAEQAQMFSPYRHYSHADDLRASDAYRVYTPAQLIEASRDMTEGQLIQFHPLCGGIHPDLAWQSLHLFAKEVQPVLQEEGLC